MFKLNRDQQREAIARREAGEAMTAIAWTFGVSHTGSAVLIIALDPRSRTTAGRGRPHPLPIFYELTSWSRSLGRLGDNLILWVRELDVLRYGTGKYGAALELVYVVRSQ
jgi:hypothetical protein